MNLLNALKGIGGEPETARTIGAIGALAYVVSAIAFQAWDMGEGRPFNVTAFCLAFSGGLSAVVSAVGVAVSFKDPAVATAKATDATTAKTVQDTEQAR